MKPADYYRDLANRIGDARDREGRLIANEVASALRDAAGVLSSMADRAKARAERIQWVYCGDRTMVAKYKGSTYRYSGVHRQVDADTKSGWVCLFPATSIESANRKIRAWRKKQ